MKNLGNTLTVKKTPCHPKAKKIKIIRSCNETIFVMAAAGYPLVVLAFGNEINWKPLYFSQMASDC
jgi:hypothetical protein